MSDYDDIKLDLSTVHPDVLQRLQTLDPTTAQAVIDQIDAVTRSNLEAKAKWNAILSVVDSALRTIGIVLSAR